MCRRGVELAGRAACIMVGDRQPPELHAVEGTQFDAKGADRLPV
jgi:hypothetical protein